MNSTLPALPTLLARLRAVPHTGPDRVPDSELLARFLGADHAAFELLFWRHGPMVWGVCRRALGQSEDAEDAFQATFVVLSRKAGTVGSRTALAAWLHQVARRTALNARRSRARRLALVEPLGAPPEPTGCEDPTRRAAAAELGAALDREIARLPDSLRLPVLLCDLGTLSHDAAARELGWPVGTLNSRLARARRALRARLSRWAPCLPAAAAVGVPAALADAAMAALVRGPSAPVRALADGTTRALALSAVTHWISGLAAAVLVAGLAFGALALGAGQPPAPATKAADPPEARRFSDPAAGPLPAGALARVGSTRLRHAGAVTGLAYSPDGRWLATVSTDPKDATARVWDAATGKEQFKVPLELDATDKRLSPEFTPRAVGFAADSKEFLVVNAANVRAFDVASGRQAIIHKLGEPGLAGAALSPDGKTFVLVYGALAKDGARVEVRDVRTGVVRHSAEHPFPQLSLPVAFSRDGRRVVVGGAEGVGSPAVYDVDSGKQTTRVEVDGYQVVSAALPDGDTLVGLLHETGDPFKRYVGVVDLKTGKLLRKAAVDWAAAVVAVSPEGKLVAVGNRNKWFSQLLDAATLKEVGRVPSTPSVRYLAFSPDGKALAGARAYGGAVSVWDVPTRGFHPAGAEPVSFLGVAFSPDGRGLAVPGRDHPLVDWRTGAVLGRLADVQPDAPIRTFVSPDRSLVAVSDLMDFTVRLHDARTGKVVRELKGHTDAVVRVGFSGDGRRVETSGQDRTLRVWDAASGRELARFEPPKMGGWGPSALSRDGRLLVAGMNDGEADGRTFVMAWDVDKKAVLARLDSPAPLASGVVLSADGRRVAAGLTQQPDGMKPPATDAAVAVWDVSSGRLLHTLPGHAGAHLSAPTCAISPDGRWLATGDGAGKVRLWEVASGQKVHQFEGHTSAVYTVAFSPDGRLLAAASDDAPCFVWDVMGTGKEKPVAAPEYDALWKDLAGADAAASFRAVRRLAAAPAAAAELVGRNLKPAAAVDADRVAKLIRELGDDEFATREAASAELAKVADRVEPTLKTALAGSTSAEARSRLAKVLRGAARTSPGRLLEVRAVAVLEYAATPEAARVLDTLAGGAKDDPLTRAAAEAREKLKRRP